MNIAISYTTEKPIYQQLYEQISAQIIKGEIEKGFCLPPIRQAAKELRISIITVKKAWEELERSGLIYTVAGKGCFVAEHLPVHMQQIKNGMVIERMKDDLSYYKSYGFTIEEIIELLKKIDQE